MNYKQYKEYKKQVKKEKTEEREEMYKFHLREIRNQLLEAIRKKEEYLCISEFCNEEHIIPFYLIKGYTLLSYDCIVKINWLLIKRIKRLCKKYNISFKVGRVK